MRTRDSLITRDRVISLSNWEQVSTLFIEREGIWYIPSAGSLIPLIDQKDQTSLPLITTPLDTIKKAYWSNGILYLFGNIGTNTVFVRLDGEKLSSPIPFPDISLSDMRIEQYAGNTFFKTRSALLFLYNNSEKIEWLVDGDILAFSSEAALYRKDGEVWRASWGEER
jgi:hypothetical protein